MTSADDQQLDKASGLSRRLLAVLVGLLATLALIVSGAARASAQNAVGPQPVNSILAVGPHQAAGQENVGVRGPPLQQTASATGVAAETAPEIAGGGGRIFVTSGRGTTYDIPEGWVGRNADNGKGLVYQRPGATGNADSIRIMEPTDRYPDGYVRVYNSVGNGQPVDAFGKPGPPADTHISQTYSGPWPGWPN